MRAVPVRSDPAVLAVGAGFFLTGVVSVLLGPIIPELRADWGVTRSQVASLFVAQFVASSLGAVLSGFHLRRSLIAGYGLIATGLAGFAAGGWPLARPAMAVTGFGLGLAIAASNLWTAHRYPERRGASLATLNLLWGLGAVSCPLLVAAARGHLPVAATLGLLAIPAALACAALLGILGFGGSVAARRATADAGGGAGASIGLLAVVATMLFVYVGVENAVGGWLVTLSDELGGERAVVSLVIGSGFWGAILVGRAGTPWVLRHLSETALFRTCLALAAFGTLLLVLSGSRVAMASGAVATGLGMAPLFPLTVSILAAATAGTRSRTAGWVLACGGLGGAALPWLTGQVTGASGTLRHGFVVPLAGLIVLTALHGAQRSLDAG